MKVMSSFAPLFLIALSTTSAVAAGEKLPVGNPDFANVAVQCGEGYAYQTSGGATCTNRDCPAQALDSAPGIHWVFGPHIPFNFGSGLTLPNTGFNPPPFTGLPFSCAAFLQGAGSEVSQLIVGFVAGRPYQLSFYLGSRYTYDGGNQSIAAYIDAHLVGTWTLVDYTPFTIRKVYFEVPTSGAHTLRFIGTTVGGQTAFVSGVAIEAVAADEK